MRNASRWIPSKYVYRKGRLVASRDPREVAIASRLITDLVAECYDRHLKTYARGSLLDLGCGKVPLFGAYKDLVTESSCVDWEKTLHGTEHLDHQCDLSAELPFDEGAFDTIVLSDVLEHVPEPAHLWREMARVLAPGGRLLMNVPFLYWLHETPHDYYRYTEYALRRFAERSGLRILVLAAIGGTPEVVTDILAKHLQFIGAAGRCAAIGLQYATRALVKRGLGRRLSQRTSRAFPLGYFLVAEKTVD